MSFINRTLGLGLGWIVLVGGSASLASGASMNLAAWTVLLLVGLGWQAIATLSGGGVTTRNANEPRTRDEEQA